MYPIRRLIYYFRSIFTLLAGLRNWPVLLHLWRKGEQQELILRDGSRYMIRGLMDAWIIKETAIDRDYEQFITAIEDGWSIIDVGAGLGEFTIRAARLNPHGVVHAYEPAPDSAALLETNLRLNHTSNVRLLQTAISSTGEAVQLDVSGGVAAQYRTASGDETSSLAVTVQSVKLSQALDEIAKGYCDFLKMDCEGAEYEILLNLDDATLARVKRICLEYHLFVTEYSQDDLRRFFVDKGWQVVVKPSLVRQELGLLYAEAPLARIPR